MKSIMKRFYPTEYAASVYDIDFEALYEQGIRGVLLDIDNTLVPHGKPADERAIALVKEMKNIGLKTCLISNNSRGRVESFAKEVDSKYIFAALKPRRKNYRLAMERMKTDCADTIFIGDQIFTDIWGANRTGIQSILVEPIHKSEEIQIVWKRKIERLILKSKKTGENK